MGSVAAKLDDMGKPAWIALMVVSFIVFWPIGLAVLAYLIGSGRMACWKHERWERKFQDRMDKMAERFGHWSRNAPSSGNRAFDEYRAETLKRLEDEQRDFKDFLERLRHAKDKAEFDQFMEDRRRFGDRPDNRSADRPTDYRPTDYRPTDRSSDRPAPEAPGSFA